MRLSGTKATAIHQYRGLGNQLWDLAGNRPSLDLPFAESKSLVDATTGTNLVDFTRASSGTYVGSDGLIKTATTNLLLRSEEFDNAAIWGGVNRTVAPNVVVAPSGSITADKLRFDSGAIGSNCQILQDISSGINANTAYSMSVYLKADDISLCRILFNCRNPNFIGQVIYEFNLLTGDSAFVGTTGTAPTGHSASAVSVGNGWYRCRVTATTPATTTIVRFLITGDNTDTGTGTNGFFMWGAQLEQSSTVGEYIPTTSTINSAPRFDHDPTTGESLGLLVEESRINRFQWSNSAVNGETWNNVGALLNLQTGATDPAGGTNGIIASRCNQSQYWNFLQRLSIDGSLPANTVVTYSVWVKPISTPNSVIILNLFANGVADALSANFADTGGFLTYSTSGTTGTAVFSGASAIPYPNGWYRLVLTGIPSTTDGSDMRARITLGSYQQFQGTPRFYWYGAQLETGLASSPAAPFVTSYMPTNGSAFTRAADVASITGAAFTSFYNQTEGTIYAEATPREFVGTNGIVSIDDDSGSERIQIRTGQNSGGLNFIIVDNGAIQVNSGTSNSGTLNKLSKYSAAYRINSFASCLDGGALTSGTGTVPTVTQLQIGIAEALLDSYFNAPIKRLTFWPQRLPDPTLSTITQ